MLLRRRNAATSTLPPILHELGLAEIIQASPAALLVTRLDGEIVYRNQAATLVAAQVAGAGGDAVLQQLRDGLRRIIGERHELPHTTTLHVQAGTHVADAEATIAGLPGAFLVTWKDVTAATALAGQTSEISEALAGASSQLAALADELAVETGEVSSRADSVAAGAEQMTASIRDIASTAASAATSTGTAVESAGTASEIVRELAEAGERIGVVSKLITSIAEQTNLLALNATIEAARAGEAGKGFAVVSGEVKELAQRTAQATGEIGEMIESIQGSGGKATAALERVVELIGQIESQQTVIASAVEEQGTVATDMSKSVTVFAGAAQSSKELIASLRSTAAEVAERAQHLSSLGRLG